MVIKRLKSEKASFLLDPPPRFCYAEPIDAAYLNWNAIILGSSESPYAGTALFLKIVLTDVYLFSPPKINFIFPIYHPNISENGEISPDFLQKFWTPAKFLYEVLTELTSILSTPIMDGTPANEKALNLYNNDRERYNSIAKNSCFNHFSDPEYQHLYLKFCFWQFGKPRKQLLNSIYEKDIKIQDLCYPNDKLDANFSSFEKTAYGFLPQKILQKHKMSKTLFSLIKAAENDIQKWIKMMMETGNIEFVDNNVEYRISGDLNNKQLWISYFQFLKEFDSKKLLQMYSLYCRFFPADFDIMEDYIKAVEEFGPSLVPWKNPFDFEVYYGSVQRLINNLLQNEYEPISCYFTFENAALQDLPFKLSFIDYILQAASSRILQKLHFSCKFLFIRFSKPVCYRFETLKETLKPIQYRESSAGIKDLLPENSNFHDIKISTILKVEKNEDPQILSNSLRNIYQCDAKYILIENQNLTKNEFKFLISNKQCVKLSFLNVRIADANGNGIMLEEVLELTPKIERFQFGFLLIKGGDGLHTLSVFGLDDVRCNPQTSQTILTLPFTSKIYSFKIKNLPNEFLEPNAFADFIVKNAAARSAIVLRFLEEVDVDYKRNFHQILKARVYERWQPGLRPMQDSTDEKYVISDDFDDLDFGVPAEIAGYGKNKEIKYIAAKSTSTASFTCGVIKDGIASLREITTSPAFHIGFDGVARLIYLRREVRFQDLNKGTDLDDRIKREIEFCAMPGDKLCNYIPKNLGGSGYLFPLNSNANVEEWESALSKIYNHVIEGEEKSARIMYAMNHGYQDEWSVGNRPSHIYYMFHFYKNGQFNEKIEGRIHNPIAPQPNKYHQVL